LENHCSMSHLLKKHTHSSLYPSSTQKDVQKLTGGSITGGNYHVTSTWWSYPCGQRGRNEIVILACRTLPQSALYFTWCHAHLCLQSCLPTKRLRKIKNVGTAPRTVHMQNVELLAGYWEQQKDTPALCLFMIPHY
jgi:hypothetical protein